jgi:hypothetical protein
LKGSDCLGTPILRVKDENGNYIPIPAIKGEPGKDYVLTNEDKQEIAEMAGGSKKTKTVEINENDHGLLFDNSLVDPQGFLIGCYSDPLDSDGNVLVPIGAEIKTIELYNNEDNKYYALENMITVDTIPYVTFCNKTYYEPSANAYFTFATVHFMKKPNTFFQLAGAYKIPKIRVTYYTD